VVLRFAKSLVGEGHPQCSAIPAQVYYNSLCQQQRHPASLAHVIFFCPVTTWTKTLDVHSFVYNMPPSSRSPMYPFIHSLADSLTPCVLTRIHPFTPPCSHLSNHACITHSIALSLMTITHTYTACCHVPAGTSTTSMQSAHTCSSSSSATCAASLSTLALVSTKRTSSMATLASLLEALLISALS